MANKKETVGITFRCPIDVEKQLNEICAVSGIKRSQFIIGCITSEYDKLQGNPKLKEMLEQFKTISNTMRELTGQGGFAPDGAGNGGEV